MVDGLRWRWWTTTTSPPRSGASGARTRSTTTGAGNGIGTVGSIRRPGSGARNVAVLLERCYRVREYFAKKEATL